MNGEPLLSARLSVDYPNKPDALRDVRFEIAPGEIFGLVGQSGSGKSTLAMAVLRLLEFRGARARGEIVFRGMDLMQLSQSAMRRMRGREIALVPQSPLTSLNGALRLGTQFTEAWKAHANGGRGEREKRFLEALRQVSLPAEAEFLRRYPHQLSVGQAQRVLIGMATLHKPQLLIADEPTSALDVITQAEILKLFASLNGAHGTAILYISHDLLSIAGLCHRIGILHEGRLVEMAPAEEIFRNPEHAYTQRLIEAIPKNPFGQ